MQEPNQHDDTPAAENPEQEPIELIADTMLGELVKFVIDEIRAAPDVWAKLAEHQQEQVITRAELRSRMLISQMVKLIAADGRETIGCDLEQITAKDEIKAVCKLQRHDKSRHALLDAVGKRVLLVVADPEPYLAGEMPRADPQQQELPVADANGVPEPDGAENPPHDMADAETVH